MVSLLIKVGLFVLGISCIALAVYALARLVFEIVGWLCDVEMHFASRRRRSFSDPENLWLCTQEAATRRKQHFARLRQPRGASNEV